jgi:hypothetical protein
MVRLALILGWLVPLWLGGQNLYVSMTNTKPTEMKLAEYTSARPRPDAKLVRLTDAQIEYADSVQLFDKGSKKIDGYYVPVRSPGQSEKDPVVVVMKIVDPAKIKLVGELFALTEAQGEAFGEAHAAELIWTGIIEGLIEYGTRSEDSTRKAFIEASAATVVVDEDFVIVDPDAKPSMVEGAVELGSAVLWLLVVAVVFIRGRSGGTDAPPPPPPPADTGVTVS